MVKGLLIINQVLHVLILVISTANDGIRHNFMAVLIMRTFLNVESTIIFRLEINKDSCLVDQLLVLFLWSPTTREVHS